MTHPNHVGSLACGCDCAGQMESNSARAESRDKAMRNSASRRKNFPNLKSWKISSNGNWTLKKDGNRITVFKKGNSFKFVINHPHLDEGKFSRKSFKSLQEAQLATFDAITWLNENWKSVSST